MLVNTLSTEDVTTVSDLWKHTLADSGFTQLTLEANLVLSEVTPRPIRKWVAGRHRLLGKGTCPEVRSTLWCGQKEFFGGHCGEWLSPVSREVSFAEGLGSHLGIAWNRLESLGSKNAFRGEPGTAVVTPLHLIQREGRDFNFFHGAEFL